MQNRIRFSFFKTNISVSISLVVLFLSANSLFAQHTGMRKLTLDPKLEPFYHGVASGDPESNRVIIWTRVTPDNSTTGAITVNWRMGTDTLVSKNVIYGSFVTDASRDYTVKVDVAGLQPNTFYYYNFDALGKYSLTGRTKTAPAGNTDSLRFALVSCANYESGYFNAYASVSERNDIDAILHLGDYIYEYETGGYGQNLLIISRNVEPLHEIINLHDYRMRYSLYRLDKDLRELHRQYPMINIWDDHESADNAYKTGAKNHNSSKEGSWQTRKTSSIQAFNEWIPIRENGIHDSVIYRKFSYGSLMDLYMLDSRLFGRDKQGGTSNLDTNRTMLGKTQLQWLFNELSASTAQWNIIGQQVMVAPLKIFGIAVNEDQWDGYPAERDKLLKFIQNPAIGDAVVLTGDIHSSWANDLKYNNSPAGVEFVTTSVTSPGFSNLAGVSTFTIEVANPHVEFVDLSEKGYMILDVNKVRTVGEWYYVPTINNPTTKSVHETSWRTVYGDRFLLPGGAPVKARKDLNAPFAPDSTYLPLITNRDEFSGLVVFGVYPNPVKNNLFIQYYSEDATVSKITISDYTGKIIHIDNEVRSHNGLNLFYYNTDNLASGIYVITIENNRSSVAKKFVKQ